MTKQIAISAREGARDITVTGTVYTNEKVYANGLQFFAVQWAGHYGRPLEAKYDHRSGSFVKLPGDHRLADALRAAFGLTSQSAGHSAGIKGSSMFTFTPQPGEPSTTRAIRLTVG